MQEWRRTWLLLPDHSSAKTGSLAEQAPELLAGGLVAALLSARLVAQIGPLPRRLQTHAAASPVL
jgi:hypothetical protein